MPFILGIDQGSTQTRAAVCNPAGEILGVGYSSGACHSIHGMEAAMGAVEGACRGALSAAGVRTEEVGLIFAGLTGADWPEEYPLLEKALLGLRLAPQVRVVNDCIVALRGGTHQPYGAIVIAGTGANCAILAPDGREYIYHYYVDDDLQGGVALGRRVLNAIYRAETGRDPENRLIADVLQALGLSTVDQLRKAHLAHQLPPDRLKELAPLLFEAAAAGDKVAGDILRSFAGGLAELVTAGLTRFSMLGMEVEVVLSGSIFKDPSGILIDRMEGEIRRAAPRASLVNARYEPVVGALLLGLQESGVQMEGIVKENIERGSQKFGLLRNN